MSRTSLWLHVSASARSEVAGQLRPGDPVFALAARGPWLRIDPSSNFLVEKYARVGLPWAWVLAWHPVHGPLLSEEDEEEVGAAAVLPECVLTPPTPASGLLAPPVHLPLNPDFPGLRLVHADPPIYLVDHFLSDEECDALVAFARPRLERSQARTQQVVSVRRTSFNCFLAKDEKVCSPLLSRVTALTRCATRPEGLPPSHFELPQVTRYTSAQRYLEHLEYQRALCSNPARLLVIVTTSPLPNTIAPHHPLALACRQRPPEPCQRPASAHTSVDHTRFNVCAHHLCPTPVPTLCAHPLCVAAAQIHTRPPAAPSATATAASASRPSCSI